MINTQYNCFNCVLDPNSDSFLPWPCWSSTRPRCHRHRRVAAAQMCVTLPHRDVAYINAGKNVYFLYSVLNLSFVSSLLHGTHNIILWHIIYNLWMFRIPKLFHKNSPYGISYFWNLCMYTFKVVWLTLQCTQVPSGQVQVSLGAPFGMSYFWN